MALTNSQPRVPASSVAAQTHSPTHHTETSMPLAGGTLLIGFDSAWTSDNSGALAGLLQLCDRTFQELGPPQIVDYPEAERIILNWQTELMPATTIVLLDQPTIITNRDGQRPVEDIVGSVVSRRRGGMQPANTSREEMFGNEAPVWPFLSRFGGPADPFKPVGKTWVFETYPVLMMIALLWTLPDTRPAGRLPKYNPDRRSTFSISDWEHVCMRASSALRQHGLVEIVRWIDSAARKAAPRKHDQDGLDACLCLLVALHLATRKDCLVVGDCHTGYIIVPYSASLVAELKTRCIRIARAPEECVRKFSLRTGER
jgi:predicted RNase H-like nuclease